MPKFHKGDFVYSIKFDEPGIINHVEKRFWFFKDIYYVHFLNTPPNYGIVHKGKELENWNWIRDHITAKKLKEEVDFKDE